MAGAVSRTATAPIDRVKMLLQTNEGLNYTARIALRQMRSEGRGHR